MLLSRLVEPFRIDTLVYRFEGPLEFQWSDRISTGERWVPACDLSVRRYFGADELRCRKFLRFLRSGCFGYFLERGGKWISYGWCTQPDSAAPPPHLPRWTARLGAYWIFYCQTQEEHRNRGHYQRLLARLVAGARERASNPLVLCDTLPENFASRAAVLHTGFVPVGVLTTYRPVPGLVLGGDWRRDEKHLPRIPRKAAPAGERAV